MDFKLTIPNYMLILFDELTAEEAGQVIKGISAYVKKKGKVTEPSSPASKLVLTSFKNYIDCERNKQILSEKRAKAAQNRWSKTKKEEPKEEATKEEVIPLPPVVEPEVVEEMPKEEPKEDIPTVEFEEVSEVERPKEKRVIFTPPSIEDVKEYCLKNNKLTAEEAEQFWYFYDSKGWMIGKNKMKKWHSAIATWMRGRNNKNTDNGNTRFNRAKQAQQQLADEVYKSCAEGIKRERSPKDEFNPPIL